MQSERESESAARMSRNGRGFRPTFLTARNADKYELYEQSVQAPEADIAFIDRVFRKQRRRVPLRLREDFCGTGWLCAEWVKSHPRRTALGIDLDRAPVAWGIRKHVEPMGVAGRRVRFLRRNVLHVTRPKVDIVVAFNFSYCTLHRRKDLLAYARTVRKALAPDGLFVLDLYGGNGTFEQLKETTARGKFTYIWEHGPTNAVNHLSRRSIHFRFQDRSRLDRAFVYDWRVWTMPELLELLEEAGFTRVDTWFEGFDKKGEGNGVFRRMSRASMEDSWIAYVVAWK